MTTAPRQKRESSVLRMTRVDIRAVIARMPLLNADGNGISNASSSDSPADRNAPFLVGQASLLASSKACSRICKWLSTVERTKNPNFSSYALKHCAEAEIGSISNGAFIAAAIHCGVPYKEVPGSINVNFGISKKILRSGRV